MHRYRMLAAGSSLSCATLQKVFSGTFELVYALSMHEAEQHLTGSIDIIVCGIHFDESRMFDLLRWAKSNPKTKEIPFVCFRYLDSDLGKTVLEGLRIATSLLGAAAFIDVYDLKLCYGPTEAYKQFQAIVTALLPAL